MILRCPIALLSLAFPAFADTWPAFRGPNGDGTSTARGLPMEWSETKNVTWKTPIPGRGWSTPVVSDSQVWLTTATEDGREMSIYCLDRKTGAVLHQEVLYRNHNPEPLGNPVNGYASPSGFIEPGRVFLHFGSYGTACFDTATFKKIWERRDLPCRHYRGPGSSLFAYKSLLIVSMDGVDVQYLAALDKATGKTAWKTDRTVDFKDLDQDGKPKQEGDMRKAYTTPILATFPDGKQHLVSTGSKATYGYDPASGKELWFITYDGFSNASSPVYADGLVFVNSGYGKANLYCVPVTSQSRGDLTSTCRWEQTKRMPLRSSPVVTGGLVYLVTDDGQATALDIASGEPVWSERLRGNFSASVLLAEGRLLFCGEQGNSSWVQPGRTFTILATNQLDTGLMASPVAVDRELYLRTKTHVYRIEKK
ncbi:MAG: PQQ-binding-like beta-propeller repeat protein [Verrucomicrobiales bacterium]|nr:PQQ-binding-like beta-propeller repeat protein [Verrucomicrobiales bacterium]